MNSPQAEEPTAKRDPSTGGGLPLDILLEASKRLGWAALIYSGTFVLAYFGSFYFFFTQTGGLFGDTRLFGEEHAIHSTVALISIGVGLAMFLLSRYWRARPQLLLDIGLVFEVAGALGISMSSYWGIFPPGSEGPFEMQGIPWECIWIIAFPVLAPNTPGKTLLASLAAASMGFLVVTVSKAAGYTAAALPLTLFAGYFFFTTYLCAGIAFVTSRVIYSFGRQLKQAREVGAYKLLKPLGKGGMGEVWLGRHRMLARPAAIKLIRPESLGADERTRNSAIRRFEREARATATLDSYHTIDIYDFGLTEEGAFYYVMELLKGVSLETLVRRFGPVPPERALYLLRQVCHSLSEAHEHGLVHRDVKPANIFTCRLGPDYDFVKVLDFGLVKTTNARELGATELTAEGVATGTPAYMAPEMAMGKAAVDGRADIYGVGCVAYWMLTGTRVFEADNPLASVLAHVKEDPVPPSRRSELAIPESLESVVMSCLEKDPVDRPQSAGALDRALAACEMERPWTMERAREWWDLHMAEAELATAPAPGAQAQNLVTVKA